jgi:hypothetical protein
MTGKSLGRTWSSGALPGRGGRFPTAVRRISGQSSSREHAALAPLQRGVCGVLVRVRPHPPGHPDRAKGSGPAASTPMSTTAWSWSTGWRPAGSEAVGHQQRGRGRDPDREERAPFQARLDLSPACAGFLIADSVLNQLSTERTHRDGSALTLKPCAPAAQSPDVGSLALGWELPIADVQPVRSRTT